MKKYCDCGDDTKNDNGVCDTCRFLDELDNSHKNQRK